MKFEGLYFRKVFKWRFENKKFAKHSPWGILAA